MTQLPAGFVLDQPQGGLPEGFVLDQAPENDLSQTSNVAAKGAAIPGDRVQPDLGRLAVTQGALFGAGDEVISAARVPLQAGANALFGGPTDPRELFAQNQAEEQAILAATREANPSTSLPAELAGSLATGGVAAAKTIGAGKGLLSRSAIGAGAGAVAGAAQGFATGDSLENRTQRAQGGAIAGGFVGSAIPGASQVIGAAARRAAEPSAKAAARALNVTKGAARRLQRGFNDSVNAGSLKAPQEGDLLLDLSPQFRGQAEAITTQPGVGGQNILDAVFARRQGAGTRIQSALDEGLGTDQGRTFVRATQKQERKAAGRMYNAARRSDQLFEMGPIRGRLNELADGLIGAGDDRLRAYVNKLPEGAVDAKTLHFVRMGLDDAISSSRGRGNLTNALRDVRRDVDDILKTNVPGWAKADKAFSLAKQKEEAFDAGRGVFQRNFGSPDELRTELSGMPDEVKKTFVQGARDAVSTFMGTARNDAGAAIRELSEKGWNKEKLELILGKGSAQRLIKTLEQEKRFADTLNVLSGNSRTAMRAAAQREFPNPTDRGANVREATQGGISGAAMNLAFRVADKLAGGALNRRSARISEDTARLLSSAGLDRDAVIVTLQQLAQAKGTALNRGEIARAIASSLTAPAALGAGQIAN